MIWRAIGDREVILHVLKVELKGSVEELDVRSREESRFSYAVVPMAAAGANEVYLFMHPSFI